MHILSYITSAHQVVSVVAADVSKAQVRLKNLMKINKFSMCLSHQKKVINNTNKKQAKNAILSLTNDDNADNLISMVERKIKY